MSDSSSPPSSSPPPVPDVEPMQMSPDGTGNHVYVPESREASEATVSSSYLPPIRLGIRPDDDDSSARTSASVENLPIDTGADNTSVSSLGSTLSSGIGGAVGGLSVISSGRASPRPAAEPLGMSPQPNTPRKRRSPGRSLPDFPAIKLEGGEMIKYVAVQAETRDHETVEVIRAAQHPVPDQTNDTLNGYVLGVLMVDLETSKGRLNRVIGYGKLDHDQENKTVTLYEESVPTLQVEDILVSLEVWQFLRMVEAGKLGKGYTLYYVGLEGVSKRLYPSGKGKHDRDDDEHGSSSKKTKLDLQDKFSES